MDTKVVITQLLIPLSNRIDWFAGQMQRSRSWIVSQALTDWVARQDATSI